MSDPTKQREEREREEKEEEGKGEEREGLNPGLVLAAERTVY